MECYSEANLGPLLFILFTNDLTDNITCPVLAYGNDLNIYLEIKAADDGQFLQQNLDLIAGWCKT